MSLAEPASRAAARAKEAEYVRVLAAPTGDALAACALLEMAFRREGIDAHVSFADDLAPPPVERLLEERLVFLVDGWHGPDAALAPLTERLVVLAHDDGRATEHAIVLDAERGGLDGSHEACASSLAFLIAHSLDKRNADLAFLALAGALAERQRLDVGLHASLVAEAEEAGHVYRRKDLALAGPLAAALAGADPFLRGVSGRARGARKLCADLRLDPEVAFEALEDAERVRLASALALHVLEQGAPASAVDALVPTDVVAKTGPFKGQSARQLGASLAGAAASGRLGESFAALIAGKAPAGAGPDPLPALIRAEREPEKPTEAPAGAARATADAIATYLGRGRPAIAHESANGEARIVASAPWEAEVDLGSAFRKAARDRAVVAGNRRHARARLAASERDAFLADVAATLEGGP